MLRDSTAAPTDGARTPPLSDTDVLGWDFNDYATASTPQAAEQRLALNIERNHKMRPNAVSRIACVVRDGHENPRGGFRHIVPRELV